LNKRNNFGAQLFPKLPLAFFPQKWEEVFSLGQSVDGLCSFFYQATIFSFSSISLSFFLPFTRLEAIMWSKVAQRNLPHQFLFQWKQKKYLDQSVALSKWIGRSAVRQVD
jgi:hypothetical protein